MKNKFNFEIIVINKPTEQQRKKIIKKLGEFLSKVWHLPIEVNNK